VDCDGAKGRIGEWANGRRGVTGENLPDRWGEELGAPMAWLTV
jgi:hypothetical protein